MLDGMLVFYLFAFALDEFVCFFFFFNIHLVHSFPHSLGLLSRKAACVWVNEFLPRRPCGIECIDESIEPPTV